MTEFPADFAPDLRRLRPWPSLAGRWRLWRDPALAAATYGELARIAGALVPAGARRVLDVGCGSGFLSLELARRGHDVVGIDADETAIALARRALGAASLTPPSGRLEYVAAAFREWRADPASFDAVVFCRSLHHIADPAGTLERVTELLAPGGVLACAEFAYDPFDRRAAAWLYEAWRLCGLAGWAERDAPPDRPPWAVLLGSDLGDGDLEAAVEDIVRAWHGRRAEQRLNTLDAMRAPLERLFQCAHWAWHPYLYWEILQALRVPVEGPAAAATRLFREIERVLILQEQLPPVLFAFVGTPKRGAGR